MRQVYTKINPVGFHWISPPASLLPKKELVRKEDRKILDGSAWDEEAKAKEDAESEEDDDDDTGDEKTGKPKQTASQRVKASKNRKMKHVWVKDGDELKAVEIEIGLTDQGEEGRTTELVRGDLEEGQEIVVGEKPKKMSFFGGGGDDD